MSSKSKRKYDEIGTEQVQYKIVNLPPKGGKKPLFIGCQKTSERIIPPASSSTLWFSYDYKRYHPFSLINTEGNQCHIKDIKLRLKLELLENATEPNIPLPEPTLTVATSSGTSECYWFSVVRPHVAGRYRFEIFAVKDAPVEPLIWEMIVTDSKQQSPTIPLTLSSASVVPIIPKSLASTTTSQESVTTSDKPTVSNIINIPTVATITECNDPKPSVTIDTENSIAGVTDSLQMKSLSILEPIAPKLSSESSVNEVVAIIKVPSTKKAPIANSPPTGKITTQPRSKEPANLVTTTAVSKLHSNSTKSATVTATQTSVTKQQSLSTSNADSILFQDFFASGKKVTGSKLSLSEQSALNRFPASDVLADGADKKIVRPGVSELKLDGSVIKLTISPALVVALLDDKSRVSMYQTEETHRQIPQQQRKAYNEDLSKQVLRYSQPSVHEILFKVQKDTKTIVDGVETFRLLRHAFEYYFDRCVLYAVERSDEVYGEILKQLRQNKKSYSGSFGAIFLLRFIIFLAASLESVLDRCEQLSAQDPTLGDVDGLNATIGGDNSSCSESQFTQIRQSRRRHQNSRQFVGSATKLQDVSVHILKELEFGSHFIFQ